MTGTMQSLMKLIVIILWSACSCMIVMGQKKCDQEDATAAVYGHKKRYAKIGECCMFDLMTPALLASPTPPPTPRSGPAFASKYPLTCDAVLRCDLQETLKYQFNNDESFEFGTCVSGTPSHHQQVGDDTPSPWNRVAYMPSNSWARKAPEIVDENEIGCCPYKAEGPITSKELQENKRNFYPDEEIKCESHTINAITKRAKNIRKGGWWTRLCSTF